MFTQPRGSTSLKMGAETVAKVLKISPVEVFTQEIGGVINNHTVIYSHVSSKFLFLPKITNKRFKSLDGHILTFDDNTTLDLKSINIVRKNFRIKYFDNFEDGFTVTSAFDVYQHGVGKYYRYDGDLPFVVAAKTEPEADEKWVSVSFGEGSGGGSSDIEITQDLGESTTAVVSQRGITEATAISRELGGVVAKITKDTQAVDWSGAHYMNKLVGAKSGDIVVSLDSSTDKPYIAANGGGGGWRYFDLPATGGTFATQQFVGQYVGKSIGGGSQLQSSDATVSIAVNPNNNAGIWDTGTSRWMLRMNSAIGSADVTKNLYLVDQDEGSTSSKIEIVSPDRNSRVGLWAYNDKRVLLSGYKDGSWGNIDVYNLANCLDFQPNGAGVSLQSKGERAWYTNSDGNAGVWNKSRASSDLMLNGDGFNIYMPVVSNPPNKYGSFTVTGYSEKFMWEANGGEGGGCYFVRRNSANVNLGYLAFPIIHGGGTVVTAADQSLNSVYVDGSGYVKKASPIVFIKNGGYATNEESRGAKVSKVGVGEYRIDGILGYNDDAAWGINGGISIPKDNNGLELVYVKDSILPDGSIVVKTYHRQHSHLPEMFQNNRKKIGWNIIF